MEEINIRSSTRRITCERSNDSSNWSRSLRCLRRKIQRGDTFEVIRCCVPINEWIRCLGSTYSFVVLVSCSNRRNEAQAAARSTILQKQSGKTRTPLSPGKRPSDYSATINKRLRGALVLQLQDFIGGTPGTGCRKIDEIKNRLRTTPVTDDPALDAETLYIQASHRVFTLFLVSKVAGHGRA